MKPGRNDPCPCGSGKKFKQCCLQVAQASMDSPQEIAWRRLRRALDGFPPRMSEFIIDTYGRFAIDEAWEEFSILGKEPIDLGTPHAGVFFPWMYHAWIPDPAVLPIDDRLRGLSPTQVFLRRKAKQMDVLMRRYLSACLESHFSFYEVLRSDSNHGMRLLDLFTGTETEVLERSASTAMRASDILYAQLVACDGVVLLEGCAPCAIPPIGRIDVIELRKLLKPHHRDLNETDLKKYQLDLRALYWRLVDPILNPQFPELRNTDDEALSMQKVIFDIDSAEEAFRALKEIWQDVAEDHLRASADLDGNGQIARIEFDWRKQGNSKHASWENTVLGNVEIQNKRLIAQVNSAERAERFKTIVMNCLGDGARFRATEVQSVEQMLAKAKSQRPSRDEESARLMDNPAIQAQLREYLTSHYESWPNEKLPVLHGKTPLQAVKTRDGREMVEALIAQIERGSVRQPGFDAAITQRLRQQLGLA